MPDPASSEPLRAFAWVVRPDADPDLAAGPGAAPADPVLPVLPELPQLPGPHGPHAEQDRSDPAAGAPPEGVLDDPSDDPSDAPLDGPLDVDPDLEADTADEFETRVRERVRVARYVHGMRRTVRSPAELAVDREVEQQAAVWVPVLTFTVTAVCAVLVVLLARSVAGDPAHGRGAEAMVALATVAFLAVGFATLTRAQEHFDRRRPRGRVVRNDVADAYETVRDGAAVLVELGVPPAALARVADLLPQAELLLDYLVDHEVRGGIVRGHAAYEQLILMGAEVTVLTDMAEERLGRRSSRRRDREPDEERALAPEDTALTPFDTLADLVAMLGPDVPRTRERRSGPPQLSRPPYDGSLKPRS